MRNFVAFATTALVIALLGFGGCNAMYEWIPAGHMGVRYHPTGLEKKVYGPGRLYVPWASKLFVYPQTIQSAVYTNDPDMGEVAAADAVGVTTNDNVATPYDITVWYRIKEENLFTLFDNYRNQDIKAVQAQAIRTAVRTAAQTAGNGYDAFQLMGPKRAEASAILQKELKAALEPKGITIIRAEFAGAYPNPQTVERLNRVVNASTERVIAGIKKQIAEEQSVIAVTRAKAEAESRQLTAKQATGRSLELLQIQQDIDALENRWNGAVPPLRPGSKVILTGDALRLMMEQAARPADAPAEGQ